MRRSAIKHNHMRRNYNTDNTNTNLVPIILLSPIILGLIVPIGISICWYVVSDKTTSRCEKKRINRLDKIDK